MKSDGQLKAVIFAHFSLSAVVYSAGHKISWTHHPGFPAVRANIARGMAELNGFEILFRVLRGPDMPWLGADTLSILLKAFSEVRSPTLFICGLSVSFFYTVFLTIWIALCRPTAHNLLFSGDPSH